jgi:hypothetical protein
MRPPPPPRLRYSSWLYNSCGLKKEKIRR